MPKYEATDFKMLVNGIRKCWLFDSLGFNILKAPHLYDYVYKFKRSMMRNVVTNLCDSAWIIPLNWTASPWIFTRDLFSESGVHDEQGLLI